MLDPIRTLSSTVQEIFTKLPVNLFKVRGILHRNLYFFEAY